MNAERENVPRETSRIACLTVQQPWADHLAAGRKRVETRSRPIFRNRVGEVVGIHAGLRVPTIDAAHAAWSYYDPPTYLSTRRRQVVDGYAPLPTGAVVALAVVEAVLPMLEVSCAPGDNDEAACAATHGADVDHLCIRRSPFHRSLVPVIDNHDDDALHWEEAELGGFAPDRWAIMLGSVHRYETPIPARGHQGVWFLDVAVPNL